MPGPTFNDVAVVRARSRERSKRVFDATAAFAGLVLLAPILLLIALAVRTGDGGPAFFRQERVGRNGRPFRMWKFRTMMVGAERMGRALTIGRDARITRVGRVLRASKLDELPQLINVLKGEMSLVGPRPEVPRYVALYSQEQRAVLELVPGITDPASIRYGDESALLADAVDPERTYVEEILPDKLRINLEYAARATFRSDLAIVLQTLVVPVRALARRVTTTRNEDRAGESTGRPRRTPSGCR